MRNERILIVDNNPSNRTMTLHAVASLGYAAEAVAGAADALAALDHAQFAAILMDCDMAGIDGYHASGEVRRRYAQIPIIAITGNDAERQPERCLDCGMDDYLNKPLRRVDLADTLALWIYSNRTERSASA